MYRRNVISTYFYKLNIDFFSESKENKKVMTKVKESLKKLNAMTLGFINLLLSYSTE